VCQRADAKLAGGIVCNLVGQTRAFLSRSQEMTGRPMTPAQGKMLARSVYVWS